MDKEKQTKILKDLIHINSVNGNELDVADYLARLFAQYGMALRSGSCMKT